MNSLKSSDALSGVAYAPWTILRHSSRLSEFFAWNGRYPATMANATTPMDQTSTGGPSYGLRDTISGAAYDGDPQCTVSFFPGWNTALSPKSTSMTRRLFLSSNRFSSFTSRCTIQFRWQ